MSTSRLVNKVTRIIESSQYKLTVRQIYYRVKSTREFQKIKSKPLYQRVLRATRKVRERSGTAEAKIIDRSRVSILPESSSILLIEKLSLFDLFEDFCRKNNIALMTTRGFASWTALNLVSKYANIFILSDFDPSGLCLRQSILERFPRAKVIGITQQQIKKYKLQGYPIPLADTRSPKYLERFGSEGYELESFRPESLLKLVEKSIPPEARSKPTNKLKKRIEELRKEGLSAEEILARLEQGED
jgi:DNA topoisomerase VI subunit A